MRAFPLQRKAVPFARKGLYLTLTAVPAKIVLQESDNSFGKMAVRNANERETEFLA